MIKNAIGMAVMLGLLFQSMKLILFVLTTVILLTAGIKCLLAPPNMGKTRSGRGGAN